MKQIVKSLIVTVFMMLMAGVTPGETISAGPRIPENKRPIISAQEAIHRAEQYMIANHIDVSDHFISSVSYVETGSLTTTAIGTGPYWYVTYELIKPSDGGQYFILIYMDGKIGHLGGM